MVDKQTTLDGKEAVEDSLKVPSALPEKIGDGKDAMSAWIKEIRRGDTKKALLWLSVCEKKYDPKAMMRRMLVNAFEDICDPVFQSACMAGWQCVMVGDDNPLSNLTIQACKAKKIYEDEHFAEMDLFQTLIIEYEKKNGPMELKMPSYALDMHCKSGYELKNQIGVFDERISGTDMGRWNMIRLAKQGGIKFATDLPPEKIPEAIMELKRMYYAWLANWLPAFERENLVGNTGKLLPETEIKEVSTNVFDVTSFTDTRIKYRVTKWATEKESTCTCPAYDRGLRRPCKHIYAVFQKKEGEKDAD